MLKWKQESARKTALLIDGAYRVGKSYIAEAFAKNEYRSYLMIDFNNVSSDVKDLFYNYLIRWISRKRRASYICRFI